MPDTIILCLSYNNPKMFSPNEEKKGDRYPIRTKVRSRGTPYHDSPTRIERSTVLFFSADSIEPSRLSSSRQRWSFSVLTVHRAVGRPQFRNWCTLRQSRAEQRGAVRRGAAQRDAQHRSIRCALQRVADKCMVQRPRRSRNTAGRISVRRGSNVGPLHDDDDDDDDVTAHLSEAQDNRRRHRWK